MKARNQGPMLSVVATEALTKNRFVDPLGAHTADKKPLGVAIFDADSGGEATIQGAGIAVVEAGGAITAGNLVSSDADGKAVALTLSAATDAEKIAGVAIDAASADGDIITVKLC